MNKTILTVVMATLCLNFSAISQEQVKPPPLKNQGVMGKVISASTNEPLSGAVIKIATINYTVVSNDRGEFVLTLSNKRYNLSISHLGYKSQNINIQIPLKNQLIVALETEEQDLKEVEINAGYYTVKDRERTGSISRVDAKTIGHQPVSNVMGALTGRMSGVQITQQTGVPGGGFDVMIRGRNSVSSGNTPLYIINGVPFTSTSISSASGTGILGHHANPLSVINPSDIESLEVLKDADATAIYGSRGANGVILIKTKTSNPKLGNIEFELQQGIARVNRKLDLLGTEEYLEMRNEAFRNDNVVPGAFDYDVNGKWDQSRNTDWQKELIGGTATTTTSQLSLNGGNVNTNFRVNSGFYRETSVFPGSSAYNRKTVGLTLHHHSINHKFNANFSAKYAVESNNIFSNDLTSLINLPPNAPTLYDQFNQLNWENGTWNNPLAFLKRNYETLTNNIIANTNLSYKLFDGLEIKTSLGYTNISRQEIQTNPLAAFSPFQNYWTKENIWTDFFNGSTGSWILEPQISWRKKVENHLFTAMVGGTLQQDLRSSQRLKAIGFSNESLMRNILSANKLEAMENSYLQYRYIALFGRLNYNYKQKVLINFTARRDGSSRFGPENQFANFGAVGAAWLFSEEPFVIKVLPFLSLGKLRASYGSSGNDLIGDYRYLELWKSTSNNYNGNSGLYPTRIGNPNFAWERNRKFDVALELGILNNKIQFSTNYYRNTSTNQLIDFSLPPSIGFTGVQYNLNAEVRNSGWEFEFNSTNIKKLNFLWNMSLNVTIPQNKLVAFPGLEESSYYTKYEIGKSLNIKRAFKLSDVHPTRGIYTYVDYDGNNSVEWPNDLMSVNLDQKFYGGLFNSFSYKGFELNFMIQFVRQTGINYKAAFYPPGFMMNQPYDVMDRWQKEGDIKSIQKFTQAYAEAFNAYYENGDLSYSDASFLRLKSASFSYTFSPKSLKRLPISSAGMFLRSQNLLTITNFNGLDPESQNVMTLPSLGVLTIGFQLKF
ncbi:SusC/RagA family TonB-linked outer membrane protein [Pedobacter sp. ASV1-7]|uniref:SusC/RagA family TonB-linked outer membrane protein n=1 Tax=Pedobacter sp. ASV1-7 TaxID=3145237 RepID=UPI0032E89FD4